MLAPPEAVPDCPLPGWPNLRSIGGSAVADGRHLRPAAFWRAPALTGLTAAEREAVRALDLFCAVDLRRPEEAARAPVDLPAPRKALPLDTGASVRALAPGDASDDPAAAMVAAYRDFVALNDTPFARVFDVVAEASGRAVLFHCTAGKDRTGVVAALILSALGVPRAAILADYMATEGRWTPGADAMARIAPAAGPAVFGVSPLYLGAALDEIDRRHGGAAAFARAHLGAARFRAWADACLT